MVKIYTKKGDSGTTELYVGDSDVYGLSPMDGRINKDHQIIQAIGAIDEANCALGLAIASMTAPEYIHLVPQLIWIQHGLFDVGAAIATPRDSKNIRKVIRTFFDGEAIDKLETHIDEMEQKNPPLRSFILPGGTMESAYLHNTRAIVRRAERETVSLIRGNFVDPNVGKYLNRLSDFLFVAARHVNIIKNHPETTWIAHLSLD